MIIRRLIIYIAILFSSAVFFAAHASAATNVFYSVGQSASDLKTGTPTVTITSGAAVFSVAQTGNIGVGDRVTYNTNVVAYIAAKTSTDQMHWTLVTAIGVTPADITGATVNSITREFTSISAAVTAASNASHLNTTNLVAGNYQLNIPCYYDSGPDANPVTITGYTTGSSNYINIYTPNNTSTESNLSQRHSGKWNDEKYRLEVSNSVALQVDVENARIDGLQARLTSVNSSNQKVIQNNQTGAALDFRMSNNIIRGAGTVKYDWHSGIVVWSYSPGSGSVRIWNNIIYDFGKSGGASYDVAIEPYMAGVNFYISNNTVYNNQIGIGKFDGNVFVKNNVSYNNDTNYYGSGYDASSTNNLSGPSQSDAPGLNPQNAKEVSFIDYANSNFHISSADVSAKNTGANLSSDPNLAVTVDIDGNPRPSLGTFDIGADEATTQVYYSVGQNTTDHKTGSPTVDISNGVATFSVAQTAVNMGVGDKITYNTTSVAYISEKISQIQWKIVTATGAIPSNVTGQTVNSIAHAFASLSAAESGAAGASYLNTANLFTGNYQLNIPCYYDSGPDTTTVTVAGYVTGPSNIIRIYTPNNTTTEVNVSQRHNGKWDDGKYRLETTYQGVVQNANYAVVDGLQIKITSNGDNNKSGIITTGVTSIGSVYLSNNIILGVLSSSAGAGILNRPNSSVKTYVYNNLIINWNNGTASGIYSDYGTIYAYNNTVYNAVRGFNIPGGQGIVKNNLVQNTVSGGEGYRGAAYAASSGYNISDLADAPGTNSKSSATVSFVDASNGNFHLSSSDTVAHKAGINLQADSNLRFGDDIDGQARAGNWDIGADEFVETQLEKTNIEGSLDSGLIGKWSFDGSDISGATTYDRSNSVSNGTIIGATSVAGKIGQALNFNGTSNYVNLGTVPSFGGLSAITACAWIKPSNAGQRGIIQLGGSYPNVFKLSYNWSDKFKIYLSTSNNSWSQVWDPTIAQITQNEWHHVCFAYQSGEAKLYVDSVNTDSSAGFTGNLSSIANDSYIGLNDDGGYFQGGIDEVRIYNRMLSAVEIGSLYHQGQISVATGQLTPNKNNLAGYWTFDGVDISGNTVYDRSGAGHNATINNAIPTIGKIGQAMGYDGGGTNNVADYSGTVYVTSSNPFSASFWAYLNDFSKSLYPSPLMLRSNTSDAYTATYIYDSGINFGSNTTWANFKTTTQASALVGAWHHVVLTYNGSGAGTQGNFKVYIDGVSETLVSVGAQPARAQGTYLGMPGSGSAWDGKLDEVRIYNKELSQSEVSALFNVGTAVIKK